MDLIKKVGILAFKMEELSKDFLILKPSRPKSKAEQENSKPLDDSMNEFDATDSPYVIDPAFDPSADLDISITSIEEFFPDIPDSPAKPATSESNSLNVLDPTTQLK